MGTALLFERSDPLHLHSVEVSSGIHGSAYYVRVPGEGSLLVAGQDVRFVAVPDEPNPVASTKTCPECAEEVKMAAKKCRYCGHSFDASAMQ